MNLWTPPHGVASLGAVKPRWQTETMGALCDQQGHCLPSQTTGGKLRRELLSRLVFRRSTSRWTRRSKLWKSREIVREIDDHDLNNRGGRLNNSISEERMRSWMMEKMDELMNKEEDHMDNRESSERGVREDREWRINMRRWIWGSSDGKEEWRCEDGVHDERI